jgi:hypothetical protein
VSSGLYPRIYVHKFNGLSVSHLQNIVYQTAKLDTSKMTVLFIKMINKHCFVFIYKNNNNVGNVLMHSSHKLHKTNTQTMNVHPIVCSDYISEVNGHILMKLGSHNDYYT